jgi:hypothetical protein
MVNFTEDTLVTTDGAADFLRKHGLHISAGYLAALRPRGKGPSFVRWGGKVRYRQNADLLSWVESECDAVAVG